MPGVSVCFPAYNEAGTVRDAVKEAAAVLLETGVEHEIIVCDDGSTDGTGAIIAQLMSEIPSMRCIVHEQNRGIRATFEDLYGAATMDYVFLNAADRQISSRVLLDMLPMMDTADIIVGQRLRKAYSPFRRVVSVLFNAVPRVLFGVRTYDAGSVKLVRRSLLQATPVISRSPFNEAERLIRARRSGHRIAAVSIETNPASRGRERTVRWAILASTAIDVGRVWWSLRTAGRGEAAGAGVEAVGRAVKLRTPAEPSKARRD